MGVTMIPQPSGMVLPRCGLCGKDIFCRDMVSQQEITHREHQGLEVMPLGLGHNLVGRGLRQDDFTCSSCLQASAPNYP